MKVENMQKTFFIIKPDAVKRHLIGQVLDRIERRSFIIERMEMLMLDEERLKEHYAQLVDKPFFPSISESWGCYSRNDSWRLCNCTRWGYGSEYRSWF